MSHNTHINTICRAQVWQKSEPWWTPWLPSVYSCWYLSSGIATRGERAVNTTALLRIHVAVMVGEAGEEHAALWKVSKQRMKRRLNKSKQILVKQSQNAMSEICTAVCRHLVPILVVKLCLEESEFDWISDRKKSVLPYLQSSMKTWQTMREIKKRKKKDIGSPSTVKLGKTFRSLQMLHILNYPIFWDNSTRWSLNLFYFPYLRNQAKSMTYWNCVLRANPKHAMLFCLINAYYYIIN